MKKVQIIIDLEIQGNYSDQDIQGMGSIVENALIDDMYNNMDNGKCQFIRRSDVKVKEIK